MKKREWHKVQSHPELCVGQYVVPNFVSNSVILEPNSRNPVIVSPGEALLPCSPLHEPASSIHLHIILPNGYHYMGAEAWQQAYPNHTLYASRAAIAMLKTKVKDADAIVPLEERQPPLPKGYSVEFPPGHRGGDVWLVKEHEQGDTWITCDSVLNYDRLSNQPIARLLQRLLGAAPGLKISKVIKFFILTDRHRFKEWALNKLAQRGLSTLIPSHGEVAQSPELTADVTTVLKRSL